MMLTLLLFLQTLLVLLPRAYTLGINCRGSPLCTYPPLTASPHLLSLFTSLATNTTSVCVSPPFTCGPIAPTDIYLPGSHILCFPQGKYFPGGICVFTEGNVSREGTNGTIIGEKLEELRAHGCQVCGSVPLGKGNDPEVEGVLKVDYVAGRVGCWGVCEPVHYEVGNGTLGGGGDGTGAENETATA